MNVIQYLFIILLTSNLLSAMDNAYQQYLEALQESREQRRIAEERGLLPTTVSSHERIRREELNQELKNQASQKAAAIDNWAQFILNSISSFKNQINQIDRLSIDLINSIKSELQTKKEMVTDFTQTQPETFQFEFGQYADIPQKAVQDARKQLNTVLADLESTINNLFRTIPVD